jgi:hypothetical protein
VRIELSTDHSAKKRELSTDRGLLSASAGRLLCSDHVNRDQELREVYADAHLAIPQPKIVSTKIPGKR